MPQCGGDEGEFREVSQRDFFSLFAKGKKTLRMFSIFALFCLLAKTDV